MWLKRQSQGRLLDVGCGSGFFMRKMQSLGWEVVGVDPDPLAARAAHDATGAPVVVGEPLNLCTDQGRFDAITLAHVIEHMRHPQANLTAIRQLLSPGGQAVVITPNAESLGFRLWGANCWHLDPPRHLFIYTSGSLAAIARTAGLVPTKIFTIARTASPLYLRSAQIRGTGGTVPWDDTPGLVLRLAARAFGIVEECCNWILPNAGEELVMILEASRR